MTVLGALNIEVGNLTLAGKYLVLQGLYPAEVFNAENSGKVEICKAYCFRALLAQPDFSEDGLSITLNRAEMKSEANRIFLANGLEDEMIGVNQPKIKNATGRW
jgi:hypothetical protein